MGFEMDLEKCERLLGYDDPPAHPNICEKAHARLMEEQRAAVREALRKQQEKLERAPRLSKGQQEVLAKIKHVLRDRIVEKVSYTQISQEKRRKKTDSKERKRKEDEKDKQPGEMEIVVPEYASTDTPAEVQAGLDQVLEVLVRTDSVEEYLAYLMKQRPQEKAEVQEKTEQYLYVLLLENIKSRNAESAKRVSRMLIAAQYMQSQQAVPLAGVRLLVSSIERASHAYLQDATKAINPHTHMV